jgi:hypothetical protein
MEGDDRGSDMWNLQLRIGVPELLFVGSLAVVAGLAVLFVVEWPIALVPAATYGLTSVAAYAAYRQHAREQVRAAETERAVSFRVIDNRGVCPAGRREGDLITVTGGATDLFVCEEARAVLRMAASERYNGREWCCPVNEHLLVFKREKSVA